MILALVCLAEIHLPTQERTALSEVVAAGRAKQATLESDDDAELERLRQQQKSLREEINDLKLHVVQVCITGTAPSSAQYVLEPHYTPSSCVQQRQRLAASGVTAEDAGHMIVTEGPDKRRRSNGKSRR